MSEYRDNGFARAQAQYDAQCPPEYPDDNEGRYILEGTLVLTEKSAQILKNEGIEYYNNWGLDDDDRELVYFKVESEWMDYEDCEKEYDRLVALFDTLNIEWDTTDIESRYVEDDGPDYDPFDD